MKIIHNYISSVIMHTILFVTFMIVALEMFFLLVNQVGDIGTGHFGLGQALEYVVLSLPTYLYRFFPMIGFLGCLLGLGILASHHELMVMRASGISVGQIMKAVLKSAFLLIIVIAVIGEGIAPIAMHRAELKKAIAKTGGETVNTAYGLWTRNGNTFTHIQQIVPGSYLTGITQYTFTSAHHLVSVSHAKKAVWKDKHWWLQNISETQLEPAVATQHIQEKFWPTYINTELLNTSQVDADEMSIMRLIQVIQYRRDSGLPTGNFQFSFWKRLWQPFSTLVMIFLAIPFILGPLRSTTMGFRLMIGILVGFSFYLANQFLGPLSMVYHLPPFLCALMPSFIFLLFGLGLMRKA